LAVVGGQAEGAMVGGAGLFSACRLSFGKLREQERLPGRIG